MNDTTNINVNNLAALSLEEEYLLINNLAGVLSPDVVHHVSGKTLDRILKCIKHFCEDVGTLPENRLHIETDLYWEDAFGQYSAEIDGCLHIEGTVNGYTLTFQEWEDVTEVNGITLSMI